MAEIIYLSIAIIVVILVALLLILFITAVINLMLIKEKGILGKNNVAVALLTASIVISSAMLCSDSLATSISSIKNGILSQMGGVYILKASIIGLITLVLAVVIALVIAFLSVKLYDLMTPNIDEMDEIVKKNNTSIGILMGTIVIALTMFIRSPFTDLLIRLSRIFSEGK